MKPLHDYRVRLLKDCPGINPEFDPQQDVSAENPRFVTLPAGQELTGPDVWVLCRPDAYFADVKAEPLDDLTRRRVARDQRRAEAILQERADRQAAQHPQTSRRRRA